MKWIDWLLGCLYPRRCPVCDQVMALDSGRICNTCAKIVTVQEGIHCQKCGKFIRQEEEEYCDDCRRRNHHFDEGFGVLPYHGWAQEAMNRYKFHKRVEYTEFFGTLLIHYGEKKIRRWKPEVIVPVPMHPKKKKKRGYNQAELLADYVGKKMGILVRNDLIKRTTYTAPQKELDPLSRRNNMRNAFLETPEAKQYKRILLIDDIYTTGSTADAIAKRFKQCGVENVYILTVCTGIGT